MAPRTPRRRFRCDAYRKLLTELDYLGPKARISRCRPTTSIPRSRPCRPAAGGADHQRALCAQRRERALGQFVRCALRHRRHRRTTAPKRARATTRSAARVVAWAAEFLDESFPLASGSHARRPRLPVERPAGGRHRLRVHVGLRDCGSCSAIAARPARPRRSCSSTTACTSRSRSIRGPGRQGPRRRRQGRRPGSGGHRHPGLRGLGGRGRCRGQGLVYGNWLGLMKGDLDASLRQGRQDVHPQAQPTTASTPRRWQRADICPAAA